jgi:hypothetical protein
MTFLFLEGYVVIPSTSPGEGVAFMHSETPFNLRLFGKSVMLSCYYSFATMSGINTWTPITPKGKVSGLQVM